MRIRDLRLFGSRARGQGHGDSDLDVLAMIDDLTAAERKAVWEYSGDILTNHEVILGGMTLSTQRWRELQDGKRRIVAEIERDGVPL